MKKMLSAACCKKIALQGLVRFREICEKYGLRYYLGYGSLLGCVRHGGFIPWDDDIDVFMLREDYEKLLLLTNEIENDDWKLLSYKTEKKYLMMWAKFVNKKTVILPSRFNNGFVYGISVDIFPLDYIKAESEEEAKKIIKKVKIDFEKSMKILQPTGVVKGGPINFIKRIIKIGYYELYGNKKINFVSEAMKIESLGTKEQTKYLSDLTNRNIDNDCIFLTNAVIGQERRVGVFENELFTIPYNSHDMLKRYYGDYMILPPEEERISPHHGKIYRIEED